MSDPNYPEGVTDKDIDRIGDPIDLSEEAAEEEEEEEEEIDHVQEREDTFQGGGR